MASRPGLSLSSETLQSIYQFLPNGQNRSNFEKTCLSFRSVCLEEEIKELRKVVELENQYLHSPLSEEGVPEEVIEMVERKIGYNLPFHLREFIKITNGRRNNYGEELGQLQQHWSNVIIPFQDWRYHSPQMVQIGLISDSGDSTIAATCLYVDLKSGLISIEGLKSFKSFKSWMQSCGRRQPNTFNIQKLISNECDLMKILKNHGSLYEYLPEEYKTNRKFINIALQSYPILHLVPDFVRNDIEIVKSAIGYHTDNYAHISDKLKKDTELVNLFVKKGGSLTLIPNDLIQDELILTCLSNGGEIEQNILEKSSQSDEFLIKVLEIVKPSSHQVVGNYLTEVVKSSKLSAKVSKRICEMDPAFMISVGLGNKNPINKKMALQIFETKLYNSSLASQIFASLPKELQSDKDVVEKALSNSFNIYSIISEQLRMERDFNLQLLTKWLDHQTNISKSLQDLKPLYDLWGEDEEFLRLTFNKSPDFIIEFPKLMDESFINSLSCHYGKLSFGEILKLNPYQGYRLAVRRNKSHPAHDLVEAKDTLQDIRKALVFTPREEDPETLDDIRQTLLSSVWYDYW